MIDIIKDIRTLATLLIASATIVACSSENGVFDNQPAQPTEKRVYTLAVNASKGDDAADTRALGFDGDGKLNATWATNENVYVKKGSTWATGSLNPDANGTTATLKGSLTGIDIEAGDNLTLQFPKSGDITYAGQKGTLADIATNFDWATATVEVESISATGNINPKAATTTFENQQAIVKFTLLNADGSALPSNPTELSVSDGTNTTTLTNIPDATYTTNGVLYVALPGFSTQTVALTARVGNSTYTYEKANASFTNGTYYAVTVKMREAATLNITNPAVRQVIGSDGKNYDDDKVPNGVTAVAKIYYVNGNNGLALAMANEGVMDWNTAMTTAAAHTPAFTGGTWKLPSLEDWSNMFSAGGTDLEDYGYWSSTEFGNDGARPVYFEGGSAYYDSVGLKEGLAPVRACLAF